MANILLFLAFAALTGGALLLLLRPLRAGAAASRQGAGESEVALYRDQLAEISRDLERGVIGETEADAARIEVSRRLLAADEARAVERGMAGAADPRWRKGAALAMAVGIPMIALAIYLDAGSPGLPGQPFAERLATPADELPLEGLIVRIERHLKEQPDDVRGWELIAPAYLQLGRFDDAANAWTRAMLIDGVTADRLVARGEARAFANENAVGSAARADFEKAVELDPAHPRAQYFLGVAELDAGERDAALARWKALLARAPDDAAWAAGLRIRIAEIEGKPAISPEDEPMIRGMVEGLAARLEDDPRNLEGWLRLIRSYGVLGERARAADALATARATFAGDPAALEQLKSAETALPE
ncbi:Tetratricopeptide domain protein [Parvibaculum lavamentivorans DS-1]|uniref:Tetratricopeptide domain protein n=1 Tax=Parvibaculum lavamentivorans (strain DS-1 / DSM 13023 / NCIMB 13966) TaxID=402881 RepID=A7HRM8_PARL1|nr:c-type cytochrome biogenesis protein CcmI [Parvibaculum lavamentivorans]ABS62561.1 Tetratricopeptide domain protein [Parvibaculum lavamentivorans DS-1]